MQRIANAATTTTKKFYYTRTVDIKKLLTSLFLVCSDFHYLSPYKRFTVAFKVSLKLCVGGAEHPAVIACQVSSYFPSLVPFQTMKCVNILEPNINLEHILVSRGAICSVGNESFGAQTAPHRLGLSSLSVPHQQDEHAPAITTAEFYHSE